jgi:hypothetical protein
LDDLGADPTPLLDDPQIAFMDVAMFAETQPGRLWVWIYPKDEAGVLYPVLSLLDLASGSTVAHPLAGDGRSSLDFLGGNFPDAGGGLVTSPAGGVYTTTSDGFRFVTEGRLFAADTDRALVETCDEALRCTRRWLDRDSWQPLDLVVPGGDDAVVLFVPGTDWVLVTRLRSLDAPGLLNIVTGQSVALKPPDPESGVFRLPAVSPDSEWLAEPGEDLHTVVLRRLVDDETKEVVIGEAVAGPVFFIAER